MNKCPNCSSLQTERIRRAVWMRLFPSMIRVYCRSCERNSTMFARNLHHRRRIDL